MIKKLIKWIYGIDYIYSGKKKVSPTTFNKICRKYDLMANLPSYSNSAFISIHKHSDGFYKERGGFSVGTDEYLIIGHGLKRYSKAFFIYELGLKYGCHKDDEFDLHFSTTRVHPLKIVLRHKICKPIKQKYYSIKSKIHKLKNNRKAKLHGENFLKTIDMDYKTTVCKRYDK